jgi:hypothetical protein
VTVAEALARDLSGSTGAPIAVLHRDTHRGDGVLPSERVERPSRPDEGTDERPSALELKGITSPPPSSTAVASRGAQSGGGRS